MSRKLNMNKIAKGLGAERRGKVSSKSGYFGALQLVADIKARFHTPSGGGRATDPNWTERRLVPFASETLVRLEELAAKIREDSHVSIELAGILLERSAEQFSTKEVAKLIEPIISRQ
jgi:hypothetical protein